MINKLIALVIISVIVVFFPAYTEQVMSWVLLFHAWVVDFLANIFSDGQLGRVIRDLLGLIVFPLVVGLVPAILFWIAKRRLFPYFVMFVWSAWLLQLGALVVLHKI